MLLGLWMLIGAAAAVPPALLGPDGPVWLGPMPPTPTVAALPLRDAVVVVDPVDGMLFVEEEDAPGVRRVWSGGQWTSGGAAVTADWPIRTGFALTLDAEGRLESATSQAGIKRRYRYDGAGRLASISWPDGSRLDVAYDAEGRVVQTRGPGRHRTELSWGAVIRADSTPGGVIEIRSINEGGRADRAIEVEDGAGRVARSWMQAVGGGGERVVAWEDPRGLQTRLDYDDGRVTVQAPGGRTWVARVDGAGRVEELTTPIGGRWDWEYREGLPISCREPTGRVTRWSWTEAGALSELSIGGRRFRLERDAGGRIEAVVSPSGASLRLERDLDGRVVGIVDPSGNTLQLARGPGGRVDAIIERNGGRWALSTDLLGRVDRVVDPTNREVRIARDGAGRVVSLEDSLYGETRIRRGAEGGVTQVVAPDGRRLGIVRDGHGQIRRLQLPDGQTLSVERDPSGDLRWVGQGQRGIEIERGPGGLPLRAGAVQWLRNLEGSVTGIRAPGMEVDLERDLAGRLWGANSDSWVLGIQHDASGLPIAWRGADGDLLVQRDANGAVVSEVRAGEELRISRDPRGQVQRLVLGDRRWRFVRDATGRVLTLEGPEDLRAGLDRDPAGRVTLIRYPGGALQRRTYERELQHDEVVNGSGQPLLRRTEARHADGRLAWTQEDEDDRVSWRYDPNGGLVAIEGPSGRAWSWAPGMIEGPDGEVLLRDADGRVMEARVVPSLPAWGVADSVLTVFRDLQGRIGGFSGDLGVAEVGYDAVGRLSAVTTVGQRWQVEWDPLGRLSAIEDPTGGRRRLRWMPGEGADADALLMVGGQQAWLPGAGEAVAVRPPGGAEALIHSGGDPRIVVDADGRALRVAVSPLGGTDSGAARLAGPGGAVQLFAGGPLLFGDVALDPVSGRPTSGVQGYPWVESPPRGPVGHAEVDPEIWAPQSPWHDPLRLAEELGVIATLPGQDWEPLAREGQGVRWLPGSLEGGHPPIGADPWSLPLDDTPLVNALIARLLPGGQAPEPTWVVQTVLAQDAGFTLFAELPPGVPAPGLEAWRSPAER